MTEKIRKIFKGFFVFFIGFVAFLNGIMAIEYAIEEEFLFSLSCLAFAYLWCSWFVAELKENKGANNNDTN